MNVLVLNAGSATLKFQVVRTDDSAIAADTDVKLARGQSERIGGEAVITVRGEDGVLSRHSAALRDMAAAVESSAGCRKQ